MCQDTRSWKYPQHDQIPRAESRAKSIFPKEVGHHNFSLPFAHCGVVARELISMGTRIGPYEGKKISVEEGMKQIDQGNATLLKGVGN